MLGFVANLLLLIPMAAGLFFIYRCNIVARAATTDSRPGGR